MKPFGNRNGFAYIALVAGANEGLRMGWVAIVGTGVGEAIQPAEGYLKIIVY
jgi:hypothetical protein